MSDSPATAHNSPPARRQFRLTHCFALLAAICVMLAIGSWFGRGGMALAVLASAGLLTVALAWWLRLWAVAVVPMVLVVVVLLLLPTVRLSSGTAREMQSRNNLRQLLFALHQYHDAYGCFPPSYITDKQGRPAHSWRVLLLEFIDPQLKERYRLDEPWNSPHNSTVAEQMPNEFASPRKRNPKRSPVTNYVAIVGKNTMWPSTSCRTIDDVTDGANQTLLLVEWGESDIVWNEPRDLPIEEVEQWLAANAAAEASGDRNPQLLGYVDGHVDHLPSSQLSAGIMQALLSPAGSESPLETQRSADSDERDPPSTLH